MAEIKKVQPKLTMKMLYEMIEQQQKSYENISKSVAGHDEKISAINAGMRKVQASVEKCQSETQESIGKLNKRITEVLKTCEDLAAMINGVNTKIGACEENAKAMATRQEQDEAVVQRCSENITAVNNNVETLVGQLNTVAQKTLQNIDSIKTLVGIYQQLQGAVKNIKVEPAPMDTLKRLVKDINQMVNGAE